MSSVCFIPNVAAAAGPSLLGYMLNWGLYGILTIQVYLYLLAFSNDRLFIQCVVYSIYALETAQTVLLTLHAFRAFGSGFGNPNALYSTGISWVAVGILGAMSACVVQLFYAYRILVISKRKTVAGVTSTLSMISMSAAIVSGVMSHRGHYYAIWISTAIWDASAVLCDILIAVSVTCYLKKHAKNTHVADTEVLVERVIQLSIETGTLTAIFSVLCLGLTFIPSHAAFYQTPILVLAKLYATTLMVHLNSRMQISSTAQSRAWGQSERARTASWFDPGGVHCTVRTVQLVDSVGSASDRGRRTSKMSRTLGGTSDAGFEIKMKGEKQSQGTEAGLRELYSMGSPTIA